MDELDPALVIDRIPNVVCYRISGRLSLHWISCKPDIESEWGILDIKIWISSPSLDKILDKTDKEKRM